MKAVQGSAIKDLTAVQFELPKFAGSQGPRERFSDRFYPPINSLKLSTVSFSYFHSLHRHSPQKFISYHKGHLLSPKQISLPFTPKYTPNQKPPKVHSSRPNDALRQSERPTKIIKSRFLLVDGNISFLLKTSLDDGITHDAEEVPLAKILDHVSPAELERFENKDFYDEDERERLLPPKKPRGRPRRDHILIPSFSVGPIGEGAILPKVSVVIRRKPGRPKGSFKNKPGSETLTKVSLPTEPSTVIKRRRGRPPGQKNVSVVIPSFNGPQPQPLNGTSGAPSESDEIPDKPKPQYSMLTASGLGQSDNEDVTSRDQSVERLPLSSKKRGLEARTAFMSLDSDENDNDEIASDRIKRARRFSETSPDPIADDSVALLRQFEAQIYGPNSSEKSSVIPHRHGNPRASLNSSHTGSRPPPSDPPTRPIQQSLSQDVKPQPPPNGSSFAQHTPRHTSTNTPTAHLRKSPTVVNSSLSNPAQTTPTRPTSPPRVISRKVSLTPHFPPSTSFNQSKTTTSDSANDEPHLPTPSASRRLPPKQSDKTSTRPRHIDSQPPKKRDPSPRVARSQSSQAPRSSKIGIANLSRTKSIKDYFAPMLTAPKPQLPPLLPSQPSPSPTSQLLGAYEEDSEDQLARESSSSSSSANSLHSEITATRPNHPQPHTTSIAAAASPQRMSSPSSSSSSTNNPLPNRNPNANTPSAIHSSEPESTDEEHETETGRHRLPIITTTTAAIEPIRSQSSPEALIRPIELDYDDENDEVGDDDDDNNEEEEDQDEDESESESQEGKEDEEDEEDEEASSSSDSSNISASEITATRPTYI